MLYGHRQINFSQCLTIFIHRVLQLQLKIIHPRALFLKNNLSWGLNSPREFFINRIYFQSCISYLLSVPLFQVFKKGLDSFHSSERRAKQSVFSMLGRTLEGSQFLCSHIVIAIIIIIIIIIIITFWYSGARYHCTWTCFSSLLNYRFNFSYPL